MATPNEHQSHEMAEKQRLSGCMVVMTILIIILLGLLGWMLLWGRSISDGENADDQSNPVSIRTMEWYPNQLREVEHHSLRSII